MNGKEPGSARALRQPAAGAELPRLWPPFLAWFEWYARRYLARHFHQVRVSSAPEPPPDPAGPLVVYLNHAAWWDPLGAFVLTRRFFPARRFYGPIDAAALPRYRILQRIGLFGVEQGTARGARQFLRASLAALARPGGALCLTPQGRFSDVRERPVRFEAGLGHLASRLPRGLFVPVALEYVFWEERLPELLVRFGVAVRAEDHAGLSPAGWTRLLEDALAEAAEALAADSRARAADRFTVLLGGRAGVGPGYDFWRRFQAAIRGERFEPGHSDR